MSNRPEMVAVLKEVVVPELKARGFKGTFPHFSRLLPSRIDLMTFQFDRYGGGFVIEITSGPATWGPHKVKALEVNKRIRVQTGPGWTWSRHQDHWFRYDDGDFRKTADAVVPCLEEAEQWWQVNGDRWANAW